MAEALFPEDEELLDEDAEAMSDEDEDPVGYLGAVNFDEALGDFSRDQQNKLTSATGVEAWEQWCINCLMTERGAYASYDDTFGIDTKSIVERADRAEAETVLTAEIVEALMADPYERTDSVNSVDFEWTADGVEITVNVSGIDDVTLDITVLLDQRER